MGERVGVGDGSGGVGQRAGAALYVGEIVADGAAALLREDAIAAEDVAGSDHIAGVELRHDIAIGGALVPQVIGDRPRNALTGTQAVGVVESYIAKITITNYSSKVK